MTCQYAKHCSKILPAFTNFDRFGLAVNGGFAKEAPLERACCRDSKKPNPPIHSAIPTIKTRSSYRGFFVSAVLAASTMNLNRLLPRKDRLVVSPMTASLAALVNRLRNLPDHKRQNGLAGIELTRYAHLSSIGIKMRVEQWSRAFILSCPFDEFMEKPK